MKAVLVHFSKIITVKRFNCYICKLLIKFYVESLKDLSLSYAIYGYIGILE